MDANKVVSFNDIIIQKPGLEVTNMDGEIVMMDIDKGKYYCLNCIGSRIWELTKETVSVKDVISILLSEYDVDKRVCEDEVFHFLNRLYKNELISIA